MMGLIGYNHRNGLPKLNMMVYQLKPVNNQIVSARTRGDLDADLATDLTDILAGYRFPNNISNNEIIGMRSSKLL